MPLQPQGSPNGPDMSAMAPAILRQRAMMLQLQEAAANGDPQAKAQLMQMQGGGGGPPPGAGGPPPGGPPGGMPPMQGAPPMGGAPPMQGAPPMSQADFSGYGKPISPDVQAAQAAQRIQLLRSLGRQ